MTNHMQNAIEAAAHRMLLDEPPCEYLCACRGLPLDEARDAIEGALPRIREMIAQEILEAAATKYGTNQLYAAMFEGQWDGIKLAAQIAKGPRK